MKILLIEDDENLADYVKNVFNTGWVEVDLICAYKGKDGIEAINRENPDVLLLDLGLPDINGFEVLRRVRHIDKMTIIILTVRNEESDIVKAFNIGADGYIVKPFKPMELLARVKALTKHQKSSGEDLSISSGGLRFGSSIRHIFYKDKEITITLTEGRIIHKLMENRGKVVASNEIAKLIWGEHFVSSINIKSYIHRLRQKIENDPKNPELIQTEPGIGYYIR